MTYIPIIPRAKLEYPTEDVGFCYLSAIDKLEVATDYVKITNTIDSFTDKAVKGVGLCGSTVAWEHNLIMRYQAVTDKYRAGMGSGNSSRDYGVVKSLGGNPYDVCWEAVDLTANNPYLIKASFSGSTVKIFRNDMTTPKATATDSDIPSGKYGIGWQYGDLTNPLTARLEAPSTNLPPALAIIEAEITGEGTDENPYRPQLATSITEDNRDTLAVSAGVFDHKENHATMIVIIQSDNPYVNGAVVEQKNYANSKNLTALNPPSNYAEAISQYSQLKSDFPEWIAGKDNYAYQVIGHESIEPLAIADFYYGHLIEHKSGYNQLKQVPDWELERTLNVWKERLERVTAVPSAEKEKHMNKLNEIFKLGW